MSFLKSSTWLYSPKLEFWLILSPPFLASLIAVFLPTQMQLSDWLWFVLIVGIDVAHVYGTLFRTYLNPKELATRPFRYIVVPFFAWIGGILVYQLGSLWFWRVLAYMAVFHFVRQQYGILSLYSRHETLTIVHRYSRTALIYLSVLYPLVYWHTHRRTFHWFVTGDFFAWDLDWLSPFFGALYLGFIGLYSMQELLQLQRTRKLNIPANLVIIGTAISWYVGIVLFDSDFCFTLTNVIAHGVPYFGIVWIYYQKGLKKEESKSAAPLRLGIPAFLGILFLCAYMEEGFWDGLVWHEHASWFWIFSPLGGFISHDWLSLLVPLLTVPQLSHYILDGLIWRRGELKV